MGGILQKKELANYSIFLYSFSKDMAAKDKVKFIRDFFGYRLSKNEKRYCYGGLLKRLGGTKISNTSFLVPNRNTTIVEVYLNSRSIDFVVKK